MNNKLIAYLSIIMITLFFTVCNKIKPKSDYPIKPVDFTQVMIDDMFWHPKLEKNKLVTIPFGFKMCESTGRIDNFTIAAGIISGKFKGQYPFDDSDVYKIIEGASYSLSQHYDADLDQYLDSLISLIAQAQEPDGYLQTWRIIDPGSPGAEWWGGQPDGPDCNMDMNFIISDISTKPRYPIIRRQVKEHC